MLSRLLTGFIFMTSFGVAASVVAAESVSDTISDAMIKQEKNSPNPIPFRVYR